MQVKLALSVLQANLFEGDIDNVDMNDLAMSDGGGPGQQNRNAIRDSWRRWPGAVVPYVISSAFSQHERSVIAKAMREYHDKGRPALTPCKSLGSHEMSRRSHIS